MPSTSEEQQKQDKPVEPPPQVEAPPPAAPEPRRPGSVKGPFKINFDFERMRERLKARPERSLDVKLTKAQEELLDEPPVDMPRLVSK